MKTITSIAQMPPIVKNYRLYLNKFSDRRIAIAIVFTGHPYNQDEPYKTIISACSLFLGGGGVEQNLENSKYNSIDKNSRRA